MTNNETPPPATPPPITPPPATPPPVAVAPPPLSPSAPPTDVLTSLDVTAPALLSAVRVGAIAYLVAWLAGLVSALLVIGVAAIEGGADDIDYLWLLTAPGQLVAMAFRSPAVFSLTSTDDDFSVGGSVSTTAPVLTILLIALIAAFRLSRRDEAAAASRSTKAAVTLAVSSAATFVVLAFVVALVLTFSVDDDGADISFGAARFQLVLFGLVAVSLAALVGRRALATWPSAATVPLAARGAWRAVLTHLAVFSVLVVPAAVVWLVVEDGASLLLALPVVLGNVLVYAVTLGHLGALDVSGVGSFMGESAATSESLWVFGEDSSRVLWILVPFAVVATLAAAVVLHERGKAQPRTTSHWVWAALVYTATGAALTFLGTVTSGAGTTIGAGGTASFGPALWFLLVFGVWGAAAELLARLVGPTLASALPAARLARVVGTPGPVRQVGAPASPAAAAGSEAAPAVAPAPPPAPIDPRTKRILIGIGSLVALVVVAFIGVSVANSMFFGPDKQVEAYVDALAEGDADRAVSLARLDIPDDERVLLTSDVLGEGVSALDDVEIGDVDTAGDTATVTVDFTIDGAQKSQEMTLEKSGSRLLFFDEWKLVDVELGSIYLSAEGATALTVNGHEVSVDGLDEGLTLPAFAGTYEIEPTAGTPFVEYEAKTTAVGSTEQSLDFVASPSPALLTEVTEQVSDYLDACIAKKESEPADCPNQAYGYDLEDVRWTLESAPTYEVEPDFAGGWRFGTETPGEATVTAKEPSFIEGEPADDFKARVDIDLTGAVVIEGESVTVEVDDYY